MSGTDCPVCGASWSERGRHADQGYCEACESEPTLTYAFEVVNAARKIVDDYPYWFASVRGGSDLVDALRRM